MNPKEIQEIKDKAARDIFNCNWAKLAVHRQYVLIDKLIELASKREVKVPTKGFPKISDDPTEQSCYEIGYRMAIEKIRELNQ